ncbi:MAG: hypothetical protein C4518_08465 [Desulfobacteraceae bacterium]|nr:MAG: hypothetical protein C4518_08465 [Desulfobacteraceae bacterium]
MQKKNRSFSPENLLSEFSPEFLNPVFCREWIIKKIHPEGARCPHCYMEISDIRELERFWRGDQVKCPGCARKFTARSKTILAGIGADDRKLILFMLFFALKMPISQIEKYAKMDKRTLFLYRHRFGLSHKNE